MQIFEVVCNNNNNNNNNFKISVLVKGTLICIISIQASLWVVIPHVSGHPSILHTSSVLINCIISKQSFFQHGLAFGVFVPAAFTGYF